MADVVLIVSGAEYAPEILVVDTAANLAALSGVALAGALSAAFLLAGMVVPTEEITGWRRGALLGLWSACVLGSVWTAAPAAQWGIPIAAALALPVLSIAGRTLQRRLREWVTGDQPGSGSRAASSDEAAPRSRGENGHALSPNVSHSTSGHSQHCEHISRKKTT